MRLNMYGIRWNFLIRDTMCSSREKQETDSVKWTKYHGFREHKMPCYREFIWRTERPHNWKSYCVMIYNRGAQFFSKYCIQNLQSMYFYCCQFAWAVFYSKKWCCWENHLFKPGGCRWRCSGGPELRSLIFLPLTRP